MINKNDSLLNIAKEVVEESKKPLSIKEIAAKVFKAKEINPTDEQIAQFGIDFMLSGDFICCGNRNKENVWDLKRRQPASILDKDVIEDLHADDEDVQKNTLTNENIYDEDIDKSLNYSLDDEDEDANETDDIAEELGLVEDDDENPNGGITEREVIEIDDEDEDEEESEDDEDLEDIVVGEIKE